MIDHFASQDIEREGDGETLADWLARHLKESPEQARERLAAPPVQSTPEWREARFAVAWDDLMNDRGIE